MVGLDYIAIGFSFLVLGLCLAKLTEGMFFSPAFIFFTVFFLHAYVDPYYRYGVDAHFDFGNFALMKTIVVSANLVMLVGYLFTNLANTGKVSYQRRIDPTFGASSFYVAAAIVALTFVGLFVSMYLVGAFGERRGTVMFDPRYRYAAAFTFLLYALVPGLWLSLYTDRIGADLKIRKRIVFCMMLAVVAYTIFTFGRQFAFFICISCLIIYHTRIRRIRLRQAILVAVGLMFVTAFALLRQLGVGATEVRLADIRGVVVSGGLGLEAIFHALFTAVPGQAVFSNVITMVDETQGYRLGATYVEALLALAAPNTITGNVSAETPALWYARNYAPDVSGHGFDFSMFAEAYLNFGVWGVFVFFFIGILVAHSSIVVRVSRNPVWIIWGSIMIVNLMVSLRNDSTPLLTRAVFFILPLLLLRYFGKRLLRPRRTPVTQAVLNPNSS